MMHAMTVRISRSRTVNIAPAKQPMPVPDVVQPRRHLVLVRPNTLIALTRTWIACATWSSSRELAPMVRLSARSGSLIGTESVVELVDHLCLVQRQHDLAPSFSNLGRVPAAIRPTPAQPACETGRSRWPCETCSGISGPMDSRPGRPPARARPRGGTSPALTVGVTLRPESGTGPRVRVDRREIAGVSAEVPPPDRRDRDCAPRIEDKVGACRRDFPIVSVV